MSDTLDRRRVRSLLISGEGTTEKIDGREYRYHREPRCHVCTAPSAKRDLIEKMLVFGYTYSEIARSCADPNGIDYPPASYTSISGHDKNHMEYQKAGIREFLVRRAAVEGINEREGTRRLVTGLALTDVVMQKAFEGVVSGDLELTVADALRAVSIQEDIKGEEMRNLGVVTAYQQLSLIVETLQEELDPSEWERVAAALKTKGIQRGFIPALKEGDVVEMGEDAVQEDPPHIDCKIPEEDPRCCGDCSTCTLTDEEIQNG